MTKLYSLPAGASIPESIIAIASKEKIHTAGVAAIGGVEGVRLAYFNHEKKKYEEREFKGFYEVTGLLGNITRKQGKPFLHVHGTFGGRDMSVIGGHVLGARVFPLLEVVLTPTKNRAFRRFDEATGLNVVYKTDG